MLIIYCDPNVLEDPSQVSILTALPARSQLGDWLGVLSFASDVFDTPGHVMCVHCGVTLKTRHKIPNILHPTESQPLARDHHLDHRIVLSRCMVVEDELHSKENQLVYQSRFLTTFTISRDNVSSVKPPDCVTFTKVRQTKPSISVKILMD